MPRQIIHIDAAKILGKIEAHQRAIDDLHKLLDRLPEFEADPSVEPTNGRGRPSKSNPLWEPLRKFLTTHHEDFNHQQLKEVLGNPDRRDHIRDAIDAAVKEGILKIVETPMGRRPGLYRPIARKGE